MTVDLRHGDCLDVLRTLPDNSVDACVTDPPYELGFMGKSWDASGIAYNVELWAQALRVLKPGGHLLAFGGTRTSHRMACAVEDAGFEIRDSITWLYGSGFPKSLDVGKAIDKARDDRAEILTVTSWLAAQRDRAGLTNRDIDDVFGTAGMAGHWTSTKSQPAVPKPDQWEKLRALLGFGAEMDGEVWRLNGRKGTPGNERADRVVTSFERDTYSAAVDVVNAGTPVLDAARQWQGFGTALKPASEPVIVARKPLAGTVAANVLEHGTGAMNVDACRVTADWATDPNRRGWQGGNSQSVGVTGNFGNTGERVAQPNTAGRWPANVVLTHGETCRQVGTRTVKTGTAVKRNGAATGGLYEGGFGALPPGSTDATYGTDGTEEIPAFVCAPGCPVAELDAQTADLKAGVTVRRNLRGQEQNAHGIYGSRVRNASEDVSYGDQGGASRFFPTFRYQAKAPASERPKVGGVAHPTVKPLALMRWLVRLVTPPGGTVLDPFAGSGTTGEAAEAEGFDSILIERDESYLPLIAARLERVRAAQTAAPAGEPDGLFDLRSVG